LLCVLADVTKVKRKRYTKEQAQRALEEVQRGMSVRKAAATYNIPRTTLLDLKNGLYSVHAKSGPATVLTEQEEALLSEWLIELCRRGIPINKDSLIDTVETIVKEDGRDSPFTDGRPGIGWFHAFMKRHPELAEKNAESISRARGALTEACIRGWFHDAAAFFAEKGIQYILSDPTRQYNGDETGFQLDPRAGRVIAPKGESAYAEAGGSKEQVSVLITTRADGKMMSPTIVYPYKKGVPKPIIDRMPEGFCAARSDTGWMTSQVFFEYMANVFIPELAQIRRQQKGLKDNEELVLNEDDWVVFWLDGYSSHLTLHTSKLCELNKILMYCFKAHSSHLCQPNDVGPFKPLKAEWRSAVNTWRLREQHFEHVARVDFAEVLNMALAKLNPESIKSGFRAAGLYPFNPDALHYDRLTEVGRRRYKNMRNMKTDASALANNTEYEITLRNIEQVVGTEVVELYQTVFHLPEVALDALPQINAYVLWVYFKRKVLERSEVQETVDEQNGLEIEGKRIIQLIFYCT
jgi:hypothetical protein